jgi:hypothetical protein
MNAACREFIALIGSFAALAGTAAVQPVVVVGTGDPDLDVPAVQAAVDQGGQVILRGRFSFNRPPTTRQGSTYSRTITLSKGVAISGSPDAHGELATIEGGFFPFFGEAPGGRIAIQALRFVRPKGGAIWIFAAGGLTVSDCRIEGVEPSAEFGRYALVSQPLAAGINVSYGGPPGGPGKPDNFSGTFLISNNDVEVGGTADDRTLGIAIMIVGRFPDSEVDVFVSGNHVRNVTEPGINVQRVAGRVRVERNVIETGVASPAVRPVAMRIVGSGSYRIAHNSINCGFVGGEAVGIDLIGPAPPLAQLANAIVVDNDLTMAAPAGTLFGASSAAIAVGGFAQDNIIRNNRIRGRARTALAVLARNTGSPGNTAFVANDLEGFQSSPDDIIVDAGATNTRIVGRKGTIADKGTGTVIVPMPLSLEK